MKGKFQYLLDMNPTPLYLEMDIDIIKRKPSSWVQNSCRIISLMFAIWDANN